MSKSDVFIERDNLTDEKLKKITGALKRLAKAHNDIIDMGYSAYLAPGIYNVVDGPTHVGRNCVQDQSVVVAGVSLRNIDAGDW